MIPQEFVFPLPSLLLFILLFSPGVACNPMGFVPPQGIIFWRRVNREEEDMCGWKEQIWEFALPMKRNLCNKRRENIVECVNYRASSNVVFSHGIESGAFKKAVFCENSGIILLPPRLL